MENGKSAGGPPPGDPSLGKMKYKRPIGVGESYDEDVLLSLEDAMRGKSEAELKSLVTMFESQIPELKDDKTFALEPRKRLAYIYKKSRQIANRDGPWTTGGTSHPAK